MSDCRFGVSPVNYPDPDPDPVTNHPFFILWSMSVMHFFLMIQALFKVNNFQHE